jgi:hypothetical protein
VASVVIVAALLVLTSVIVGWRIEVSSWSTDVARSMPSATAVAARKSAIGATIRVMGDELVIHARSSRVVRRAGALFALAALAADSVFVWMLTRPPIETNVTCDRGASSCTVTRAREAPMKITFEEGARFEVRTKPRDVARGTIVPTYCPVLAHQNGSTTDLGPFCVGAGKGQVEALGAAMKKLERETSATYSSAKVPTDGAPFFAPTLVFLVVVWFVFFLRPTTSIDPGARTIVIRGGSPKRINFDEVRSIEVKGERVLLHVVGDITEPLIASGEVRNPRLTAESVAAIVGKPIA